MSNKRNNFFSSNFNDDFFNNSWGREYGYSNSNYNSGRRKAGFNYWDNWDNKKADSVIKQFMPWSASDRLERAVIFSILKSSTPYKRIMSQYESESYITAADSLFTFLVNIQKTFGDHRIQMSNYGHNINWEKTYPDSQIRASKFKKLLAAYGFTVDQTNSHYKEFEESPMNTIACRSLLQGDLFSKVTNTLKLNDKNADSIPYSQFQKKAFNYILSFYIEFFEDVLSCYLNIKNNNKGQEEHVDIDVMLNDVQTNLSSLQILFLITNKFVEEKDFDMISNDYFKNFKNRDLDFDIKNENQWWFNILSNTDNYVMKIITNDSDYNSLITSKNLSNTIPSALYKFIRNKMKNNSDYSPQDFKNDCGGQGNSNGDGDENQDSQNNSNQDNPSSGNMNQDLKDALTQAADQSFEASRNEIKSKKDSLDMLGIDPSKATEEEIRDAEDIMNEISNVNLNKKDVERFVKTSIKNFNSSFRGHKEITEESFLEADEVDDLRDLHLLADLNLIEDMAVNTNKYSMKFNLYVDCSGSMNDFISINDSGDSEKSKIKRMTLAKILAYKMKKMNILNDIFAFTSYVEATPVKDIIKELSARGGTEIDNAILHIAKNNIPSIILSDGDDTVEEYNSNAYLFTISETCLGSGTVAMTKQGKAIHFDDGKFIPYTVKDGEPVINW